MNLAKTEARIKALVRAQIEKPDGARDLEHVTRFLIQKIDKQRASELAHEAALAMRDMPISFHEEREKAVRHDQTILNVAIDAFAEVLAAVVCRGTANDEDAITAQRTAGVA